MDARWRAQRSTRNTGAGRLSRRLLVTLGGLTVAAALLPFAALVVPVSVARAQCCPLPAPLTEGAASIAVIDPLSGQRTQITEQGRTFALVGSGFPPDTEVTLSLDSPAGLPVGSAFTAGGNFTATLLIPPAVATHYHTLFATDGSAFAMAEIFINPSMP